MLSNVGEYRDAVKRFLPELAFCYLQGGAEDEVTMRRNQAASQRITFEPRALVGVTDISTGETARGPKRDPMTIESPMENML